MLIINDWSRIFLEGTGFDCNQKLEVSVEGHRISILAPLSKLQIHRAKPHMPSHPCAPVQVLLDYYSVLLKKLENHLSPPSPASPHWVIHHILSVLPPKYCSKRSTLSIPPSLSSQPFLHVQSRRIGHLQCRTDLQNLFILQNWNSMPTKHQSLPLSFSFFLSHSLSSLPLSFLSFLPFFFMDNVVKKNKVDKTLGQHNINFSALAYFDTYLNDKF